MTQQTDEQLFERYGIGDHIPAHWPSADNLLLASNVALTVSNEELRGDKAALENRLTLAELRANYFRVLFLRCGGALLAVAAGIAIAGLLWWVSR